MNEQIKELYEQATTWALDNYPPPVNTFMWEDLRNKKFAELIVRECLSYVDDSFGDVDYVKFMIKRDFGVEE